MTPGRFRVELPGMDEYGPSTYGDRIAEVYDEWFPESSRAGDVDPAVSFLRELAAAGPALELGIGTGRVAVPLHREGVEVHGIDASEALLARLRTEGGRREHRDVRGGHP